MMSMTSAVVPSDFFFFDFEADFGELVVFEPQAPHRGIPMMNTKGSHFKMLTLEFEKRLDTMEPLFDN